MSFMDPKLNIGIWGTYDSDTELKFKLDNEININLVFFYKKSNLFHHKSQNCFLCFQNYWIKNPTVSSQESGMSFMDPKQHI